MFGPKYLSILFVVHCSKNFGVYYDSLLYFSILTIVSCTHM